MKKLATILVAIALVALTASAAMAANQVRISQVYGGGGASSGSPTWNQDYVELFNSGGTAVDVSNWAVEYGSATGNWGSATTNYFVIPAGTSIQPCSYLLIGGSVGTAGAALSPAADFSVSPSTSLAMSASNGKVGLFSSLNSNVACGSETGLVDKVAYGTGSCAEITAVAALTTTTGAVRNNGGLTDTDNNSADFTVVTAPTPRNSHSTANAACLATPTHNGTWGSLKSIYR